MATSLPPRADLAGTPSNAQAKAALTAVYDYLDSLLGPAGTADEARGKLGLGVVTSRSKLINPRFVINQLAKSGTVTLTAGQYGHDGWKAGAGGCAYTFATVGTLTTITITAGTLLQVALARKISGGNYVLSWSGTAQGRIAAGAYAASPVTAAGVTAAANISVEFGTGTLTKVQFEPGTVPSIFEEIEDDAELLRCKTTYQTSYINMVPGTVSAGIGRLLRVSSSTSAYADFQHDFVPAMEGTPAVTFYNPSTGATGTMQDETVGTPFTVIGLGSPFISRNNFAIQASTAPGPSHVMSVHFTADARP